MATRRSLQLEKGKGVSQASLARLVSLLALMGTELGSLNNPSLPPAVVIPVHEFFKAAMRTKNWSSDSISGIPQLVHSPALLKRILVRTTRSGFPLPWAVPDSMRAMNLDLRQS